jgi:hypothetical protein
MKALCVMILTGTLFMGCTSAFAEEAQKYRVEVNVVFNSVTPEKAIAILREALDKAGGACKFKVEVFKPKTGDISTSGGSYIILPDENSMWHFDDSDGDLSLTPSVTHAPNRRD